MCYNFLYLRRHTSIQQKFPADLEKKLKKLMDDVKTLRERHNFPDDLIINMNGTLVYFDMPRSSTITRNGATEVQLRVIKGEKKCVR